MKIAQPYATGYAHQLDADLVAFAHADGSLSLERVDGSAVDLPPDAVEALAELLKMSGALRSAARRRRSRAAYSARWGE
jgi:hypothetical protein